MNHASKQRALLVLSLLLFVVAMSLALFRLLAVSRSVGSDLRADWAMIDFRSAVYYPAVAFVHGDNPYDHESFVARYPTEDAFPPYLPATLLVNAPLALMREPTAAVFYFLVTLALTAVTALLALRLTGLPGSVPLVLLVTAIMILSRPGHMNLLVGQGTLLYVLGAYVALWCAGRSPAWSGLGVCFASLKPTFGIPLILMMLVERRFKAILFAAGIGALMNLPPVFILAHNAGGLRPLIASVTSNFGSWRNDPVVVPESSLLLVSASGVISRLADRPLGSLGEAVVCVLLLGAAAGALRTLEGRDDLPGRALAVTIISLAALTAFHHQPYDLLILTLPCVALLGRRLPAPFHEPRVSRTLLGLFALLTFNYLASYSGVEALHLSGLPYRIVTSINGIALLAAFFLVVSTTVLSRRRIPAGAPARSGT